MFNKEMRAQLREIAKEYSIPSANLMAVIKVESGGKVFAKVGGRNEPLIRFEGHYFYRQLGKAKRNIALAKGLAHWRAGHVKNPFRQSSRWALLEQAKRIDANAALCSTSWGLGQVMGIHWRWLGYGSVEQLAESARSGFEGQVRLMMRYIVKAKLLTRLATNDWAGFARGYNGPAFRKYGYDKKLARAHRHFVEAGEDGGGNLRGSRHGYALLRIGARGEAVTLLQTQLRQLGYHLIVDGDFGPATQARVKQFQRENRLKGDGIVGPKTFEMLMRKMPVALD